MNNNPNALPSYNIADVDNEIGFYKTLFHLHDKGVMSCLPAIVEKYDRATHIAEVKPLVKATMRLENEEVPFDRPTYRVPVQQICHGGFNIDAPLFVGDTGLLFAIDREWITARKRNSAALKEPQDPEKGEENPNKGAVVPDSYGLASFEYGFFLPCSWAKTDLRDEDGFVVRTIKKDSDDDNSILKEIRITKEEVTVSIGSETYKISKDGISFDGDIDESISVITDIRYDKSTHQIQKKTRELNKHGTFIVGVGEESEWVMIPGGQAEPLPEG